MKNQIEMKYAKDKYFYFKLEIGRRFGGNMRQPLKKDCNKLINDVTSYFTNRPNDLLILNVAQPGSYKQLADFLNVPGVKEGERFPWLNKT